MKYLKYVLLLFFLLPGCSNNKSNTIEFGAILPLTGNAAQWGKPVQNSTMMAEKEINDAGGVDGKKIKIIYEDSQANPSNGVSAMQNLINNYKPVAVIGAVASSVSLAIAPIANKNKIPLISPASTSPKLTKAGDYFFRVIPSDNLRSNVFAEYIYKHGKLNLDVLFINNQGGVGATDAFVKKYTDLGGKISYKEGYDQGTTDFRSQLARVKDSKATALVIVSYPDDAAILLRQIKELGIKKKIYALTEALDDPNVVKKAGGGANGVTYITPATAKGKIPNEFKSTYKKAYGVAPPTFSAEGYDIVYLLEKVIEENKQANPVSIKDSLYTIKNFQGASGIISFDQNGDVVKPMSIKIIKNNKSILIN